MYRCTVCKSSTVEEKMWVDMNTMKLSDNYHTDVDLDDKNSHFCNKCESLCTVYDDEEEELNNIENNE